jgi:hypothetical protein
MRSRTSSELLFDLFSYARHGPGRRDHLSAGEIEQVARTTGRAPEVMVKVLTKGAASVAAVRKHLDYIGRKGEVDLETDDGEKLCGEGAGKSVVEDWDLDLDEVRRKSDLTATRGRNPPRLVHKVLFSMPAGTPSAKVLMAVQNFCREEFALKHRYALALHTDEPHPHVHVVIKAISEQGKRLNIRKATLREWREEFARHLRALGLEANATQRSIRGITEPRRMDGIYRPMRDPTRYSTHVQDKVESVAAELLTGQIKTELGKAKMLETRKIVERGWRVVSDILINEGRTELAARIRSFANQMLPPRTEKEQIGLELVARLREQQTHRQQPTR